MDESEEYIRLFVAALHKNSRYIGKLSTQLEQMKKTLGQEGAELYKRSFDPEYGLSFVEKRIIELQMGAIRWLLEDYDKSSMARSTTEELTAKYGDRINKECHKKKLKIREPVLKFLVAFTAFLKKKVKGELDKETAEISIQSIV